MIAPALALLLQVGASLFPPAAGGPSDIGALPTGILRVTGVPAPGANRPHLVAARVGLAERPGPIDWDVPEAAHGVSDGVPWSSFRLPAGPYTVLVDRGPLAPALAAGAEVIAGREVAAAAVEVESRTLTVRARDAAKAPVSGARVLVPEAVPAERALALLLARRAGAAERDGVLDFGIVPAAAPLTIQVSAPGYRRATLKLGALFEGGSRDLTLSPNQDLEVHVTGLAGRRGEARPEIALARCKFQQPGSCLPQEPVRQILDVDGRARFRGIEGGKYNAELRVPGVGSTRETVEIARDGDAPTLVVEFAVGEWTLRGVTRVHAGNAVSAHIKAMESVRGHGEGTAAETQSAPDGTFEMTVVSRPGRRMILLAESDDPHAKGGGGADLVEGAPVIEGLGVELDATGVEVAVTDALSGEALRDCPVEITLSDPVTSSARSAFMKKTDSAGIVTEYALAESLARVAVSCPRYYAVDVGRVDVPRDQVKRVDVRLRPAQDLVVVARDENGSPVSGVSALVLTSPLSLYRTMEAPIPNVGETDAAGEIRLPGDLYGGRPLFLLAPGHALGFRVLPMPSACDRPEDCRVPISIPTPRLFGGLLIRNESGERISPLMVSLSRDGVPIPRGVLSMLLWVNGLLTDALDDGAVPLEVRAAAFLSEGTYLVTLTRVRTNPKTGKKDRVESALGTFTVPSPGPVELVDRDGPPPNAQAPRVAGR